MPMPDGSETPQEKAAREGKPPPHQRNQAPTDFVNFSRRFGANKDVAQREAAGYGRQAEHAAGAAQGALKAAQGNFAAGVNTGTVGAAPNNTGWVNTGPVADLHAGATDYDTPPGPTPAAPSGPRTTIEEMLAKAGQQYTGPAGLDTVDATKTAQTAQQQLEALKDPNGIQALVSQRPSGSHGADALSGALIGSAGRQQFDALRAKFNPNKDLLDAQKVAVETAKKAKETSDANAKGWGANAAAAQAVKDENDASAAAALARAQAQAKKKSEVLPEEKFQESFKTLTLGTQVPQGDFLYPTYGETYDQWRQRIEAPLRARGKAGEMVFDRMKANEAQLRDLFDKHEPRR